MNDTLLSNALYELDVAKQKLLCCLEVPFADGGAEFLGHSAHRALVESIALSSFEVLLMTFDCIFVSGHVGLLRKCSVRIWE